MDVSFMRFVESDADWKREVAEVPACLLGACLPMAQDVACVLPCCAARLTAAAAPCAVIDVYSKNWGPCEMMAVRSLPVRGSPARLLCPPALSDVCRPILPPCTLI